MTQINTKFDEFTGVLLLDTKNIDNLDTWTHFCNRIIRKIERELHFDILINDSKSRKFPAGYNSGVFFGNHYLTLGFNNNSPKLGLILRFSAKSLTEYLQAIHLKINDSFQINDIAKSLNDIALQEGMIFRLTRLDATIDFIDYQLSVNDLYNSLINGQLDVRDYRGYHNRSKIEGIQSDGITETFYIGSRKAQATCFMRIYDKKVEILGQKEPNDSEYQLAKSSKTIVRFEQVNRGKRAYKLTEQLLNINNDVELSSWIYQLVSDKFRFFNIKKNDFNFVTDEMLKGVKTKTSTIKSDPTVTNDLDKKMAYWFSSNAGFQSILYIIRKLGGNAEVEQFLKDLNDYNLNDYEPSQGVLDFVSKKIKERDNLVKQANSDDEPPI